MFDTSWPTLGIFTIPKWYVHMLEFQKPNKIQQHLLIEDSLGEVHGQNFSGILGITWILRNLQHQKQTMRPIRKVSLRDLSTSPLYVFVIFYDPFLSSGSGWIVLLLQRPKRGVIPDSHWVRWCISLAVPLCAWKIFIEVDCLSTMGICYAHPRFHTISSVFSSTLDCCCHSSAWSYFKFCLRCRQSYPHDIYYLMLFNVIKYYLKNVYY